MKQDEATRMAQSQEDSRQAMDLLSQHVAIAATRTTPDEDQEAVLRTIIDQETVETELLQQSSALAKRLDDEEKAANDKATVKHNGNDLHECEICYYSSDRTPMTYMCCGKLACWKCFTNPNVSPILSAWSVSQLQQQVRSMYAAESCGRVR